MTLLDARRLTGPGVIWDHAGAIVDVDCSPEQGAALAKLWPQQAAAILAAVGWGAESTASHRFLAGTSLVLSAPMDALYAAVEIATWAYEQCAAQLAGRAPADLELAAAEFRQLIAEESNPALLALRQEAAARGLDCLSDDDEVSVGLGRGSAVWPVDQIPVAAEVDWAARHNIPLGIVTGTNGKTTTVRIASHIIRAAGLKPGLSSTDWLAVNGEVIETGDYAGPGGARCILRHPEVDVAVLETARGGLLRRGLGVARADVALITNVAEDHLGDYGSQSLAELLDIKWVLSRAVREQGQLILNAEDALLVAKARDYPGQIIWFSASPVTAADRAASGQTIWTLRDQVLCRIDSEGETPLVDIRQVPMTFGGAAAHNVANALAAAAFCSTLGIADTAIVEGLTSMQLSDNPGRSNLFAVDGVQVLVDFAHNVHGMQALAALAKSMPARRRVVLVGQAGDRTDRQIREFAEAAWSMGPDRVIVSELAEHYRGRDEGEVNQLVQSTLRAAGAAPEQFDHYATEPESLRAALAWAQPGDLVVVLALAARGEIIEMLSPDRD